MSPPHTACRRAMLINKIPVLLSLSVLLCFQSVSGKGISVHHFPATVSAPEEVKAPVSWLVFYVSAITGLWLHLLPSENIGDTRVPKLVFAGLPCLFFHAFVICVCFAFIGAFSSLLTQDKPKYAKYEKFCRFYAVAFLGLAFSVLLSAIFFRSLHFILEHNDAAIFTSR